MKPRTARSTVVLITGATGFIGHHCWEHIAYLHPDWEVIILDSLSYSGNLNRLTDIDKFPGQFAAGKIRFVRHDICASLIGNEVLLRQIGRVDHIIHFAAQTHVDRSLENAEPFVTTNVLGTYHMLEFARAMRGLKTYVQISTDEVYGAAPEGVSYREWDRVNPSNPYAASKAGADALVLSYIRSYKLPAVIIRTMNNIGERQHPEKFVPKTIRALLKGQRVTVHGNKLCIGSRCWIHPRNFADGILFVMKNREKLGDIVHIAGTELTNLDVAELIADELNLPLRVKLVDFHRARLGHDRRYAMDDSHIRSFGWTEPVPFKAAIGKMVRWMAEPARRTWLGLPNAA